MAHTHTHTRARARTHTHTIFTPKLSTSQIFENDSQIKHVTAYTVAIATGTIHNLLV